jgi:hypothetical protein
MTTDVLDAPSPSLSLGGVRLRWMVAAVILLAIALTGLYVSGRGSGASPWAWMQPGTAGILLWLIALLPGAIIINHVVYLASSRRKQFRQALGLMKQSQIDQLEGLYFGYGSLTVRYVIPAVLVTALSILAMTVLSNPNCYLKWLYVPVPGLTAVPPGFVGLCSQDNAIGTVSPVWPVGWAWQILTGAGLGFVGAYVYLLILLTDRARQRDVTTGIAVWAAAMPVLGPVMGGVSALLISSGTGAVEGSFTQYAVFFVAGMLPRQFAMLVQNGVSKMLQDSPNVKSRTLPLTVLRGIGPEVAGRLEEEGIADVSSLAYASPHQLIRGTNYAPRQIADWIDEALLTVNLPDHWEAIEKLGVTGAMDLAWYVTSRDSIPALADEIKINETLLRNVIDRMAQDAQVSDLSTLYWDHSNVKSPLAAIPPAAHDDTTDGTPDEPDGDPEDEPSNP